MDKTFNSVNEFVHDPDTSFEQLQWMCLTLASRLQHSRDALEKIRDTAKSWEGRKDAPKTSTMETVFGYSGRIYVRPMGRGIVLGEDEELDDAVPAGDYVAEIVIRKAADK